MMNCPYCGSKNFVKTGRTESGSQRYICRNKYCGRRFSQMTAIDTEIVTQNVNLAKQRQKFMDSNRIERKSFREFARLENAIGDLSKELINVLKNHNLKGLTIQHPIKETNAIGIFHFTDPHFNELVSLPHNRYDFEIASQRARKFVQKAIIHFKRNNIGTVVFADTGDKLNSDRRLDEILSNATNRSQAQFLAVEIMKQMILELNKEFNIIYTYVIGNESRIMEDIAWSNAVVTDSYDYNISQILKLLFEDCKGITFVEPDMPMKTIMNVNGENILLTHGIKFGNDPHKHITKMIRQYADKGITIDFVLFGHIHEALIADLFARGSSLVGANAYSEDGLLLTSRASQNIHIVRKNEIESIKIDLQDITGIVGYDITKKLEAYNAKSASKTKTKTTIFEVVT